MVLSSKIAKFGITKCGKVLTFKMYSTPRLHEELSWLIKEALELSDKSDLSDTIEYGFGGHREPLKIELYGYFQLLTTFNDLFKDFL